MMLDKRISPFNQSSEAQMARLASVQSSHNEACGMGSHAPTGPRDYAACVSTKQGEDS